MARSSARAHVVGRVGEGGLLASQTLHPSIEKPMLDGLAEPPPDHNPSCIVAEERGRRLARAVLESMEAIKVDAVVYPSWNNPPH
jgi:hypothetical protein